jgi:hypothetical protein
MLLLNILLLDYFKYSAIGYFGLFHLKIFKIIIGYIVGYYKIYLIIVENNIKHNNL